MSQTSGIGSSREDRPPAEHLYSSSPSASKMAALVQETVLNPEGRRLGGDSGSSSFELGPHSADSRVWKRLFPGEAGHAPGDEPEVPAVCELGHFVIEERIGAGGMGAVFRALDTRLQRVVALKVLSPSQSRDRASVLRFQNEARAAARLDHENIARAFFIGEDRGLHFIAFEYVTGQNVRDLIVRTGRLAVPDAVNYALQIATALRHTASSGVVHRDIKPSNIIITPSGRAKLVDLGLARKLAPDGAGDLTVAGTTLGTFDYISPEQARDPRNVDVRSDIYSLGCTLYHMLTGGPPYSAGTVLQKLLDHQSGHAPDPRGVNAQVSPALAAICRKMMAGDPRNRYSTPDELIRDLAGVAASLGLRPMPADGYVWARPAAPASPRVRSGVIWAASLAVVVLFAFAVDPNNWTTSDPDRPTSPSKADRSSGQDSALSALGVHSESLVPSASLPPQSEPAEPRAVASDIEESDAIGRGPSERDAMRIADRPGPASRDRSASAAGDGFPVVADSANGSDPSPEASAGPTTSQGEDIWEFADNARAIVGLFLGSSAGEAPQPDRPSAPAPVAEAAERLESPFVLVSPSNESNVYDSLAQAVEAAFDGDVIELRYDGRPPGGPAEPFAVRDKAVTIRAGAKPDGEFYRPVIEFVGDSERNLAGRAITLSGEGGGLELEGVELRMSVEREARNLAGRWALFALADAERVRLTGSVVTLVNPKALPLTVFDLRPPDEVDADGYDIMGMMNADRASGFSVTLERCLVRGEADLVTIAHTLPGRVTATDSAFALGSALLNVTGGVDVALAGYSVDVELDHVTAVVGGGALQLDLADGREATPLRVNARDSLFAATTAGPLVEMNGDKPAAALEQVLTWDGRGNVFDGYSRFWTIFDEDGSTGSGAPSFRSWLSRWKPAGSAAGAAAEYEIAAEAGGIWARPDAAKYKSRSEVTARDLELDAAADRLNILEAANGGLIGASPDRLPDASRPPAGFGATGRTTAADRPSSPR